MPTSHALKWRYGQLDVTDRNVTEADIRQMREEVTRLYAEAMARLREAAAANRKLRAAQVATYSTKEGE